jgi:hypothetical protein
MTVEEITSEKGRITEVDGFVWLKTDKFIPEIKGRGGRAARFLDNGETIRVMVGTDFIVESELKTFAVSLAALEEKFEVCGLDGTVQTAPDADMFDQLFGKSPEGEAVFDIWNDFRYRFGRQAKLYDADTYEDLKFGE